MNSYLFASICAQNWQMLNWSMHGLGIGNVRGSSLCLYTLCVSSFLLDLFSIFYLLQGQLKICLMVCWGWDWDWECHDKRERKRDVEQCSNVY